jgi:hypothetical protein
MAQINVVSNTEDNSLSVSINGSAIPNVTDVGTYRDVDSSGNVIGFYVRVTAKELVSEGLWKIVEYYSYGSPQAMAAEASGNAIYSDDLPGFVGVPAKTKTQKDIENFFAKK